MGPYELRVEHNSGAIERVKLVIGYYTFTHNISICTTLLKISLETSMGVEEREKGAICHRKRHRPLFLLTHAMTGRGRVSPSI